MAGILPDPEQEDENSVGLGGLLGNLQQGAGLARQIVPQMSPPPPSCPTCGSSIGADQARSIISGRIRQITYDRGLTRKVLDDPSWTNPQHEVELKELRSNLRNMEP